MSLEDLIAARQAEEAAHQARLEKIAPNGLEPKGVASVVTPAGLAIYYQAAPKRLYRVRERWVGGPLEDLKEEFSDWVEVPSVSTILGCLEKGGLSWWGMCVGVGGVAALVQKTDADYAQAIHHALIEGDVPWLVDRLKAEKLTVNHVKSQAADRGTNVHSALELYADTGTMPNPEFFPETERGYVEGLVAFLNDAHPNVHHSELMVGSVDGFAGRFDLVANLDFAGKVVTKTYPKRQPIRSEVGGTWLLDLKTSKDVYPSYHLQTAAYRSAMSECGYGEVDYAGVLRVTADGRYELVEARAEYEDFLSVLSTYKAIERIK